MRNRFTLALALSLVGFLIGSSLESYLFSGCQKKFQVGSELLTARWSDSSELVVGAGRDKRGQWFCQVWSANGKEIMPRQEIPNPPGRLPSLAWREDGREFAIAAGSAVWVFDPKKGRRKALGAAHLVRYLEYKNDKLLARTDQFTFLWNAKSHKLIWQLGQAHLLHATLDATGSRLATSCYQDGVRVFDTKTKKAKAHLEAGTISCGLKFSRGGQWLTIGLREPGNRRNDRIKTFDVIKNKWVGPTLNSQVLYGIDVSTDGLKVMARCGEGAAVWNPTNGQKVSTQAGEARLIDTLSRDGRWVVSALARGRTFAWNTKNTAKQIDLETKQAPSDIRFENNQDIVVVDGQATLWAIR